MPRTLDIVIMLALVLWAFGSSSPQQPLDRPRNVVPIGYDPEITGVYSNARYQPIPKGYAIGECTDREGQSELSGSCCVMEGTLHGEPFEGSQRLFQDLRKVQCEGDLGIFSRNFPRRCSFMIEEYESS